MALNEFGLVNLTVSISLLIYIYIHVLFGGVQQVSRGQDAR